MFEKNENSNEDLSGELIDMTLSNYNKNELIVLTSKN